MADLTPVSLSRPVSRWGAGPIDVLRATLYGGVLVLALAPGGGRELFLIAGLVAATSLALQLIRRRRPLSLISAWEAGFILLIAIEGFRDAQIISDSVGRVEYLTAARYLVAANALVVLVHLVVYRPARRTWQPNVSFRFQADRTLAFLIVLAAGWSIWTLPRAQFRLQNGRVGTYVYPLADSGIGPLLDGLVIAAGLILPAMIVYYTTVIRGRSYVRGLLLTAPIFLAQFVIGSRFPLLFGLAGVVLVRSSARAGVKRGVIRLLAAGLIAFVFMNIMAQSRTFGLANASTDTLLGAVAVETVLEFDQGVVRTSAQIVDHYGHTPNLDGRSTTAVLVFWVPRTVWADKPELLGFWFPREYGLTGFSEGHSVSSGFAGDAYVDFGFWGGLVLISFLGLALGAIDRAASRILAFRGHPLIVLVAPLYGAAFFTVRSLNTAIIAMSGAVVLAVIFRVLSGATPVEEVVVGGVKGSPDSLVQSP